MYSIETFIELPIAKSNNIDINKKLLPTLTGCNYLITIKLSSDELDKNGMVVDFKKMKKIIHAYLDQFDHSMILTPDNPLVEIYKKNYKQNGIDFERSRIFIWNENPTAEYMAKYWHAIILKKFVDEGLIVSDLIITVEETSHNSVSYSETAKNTCEYMED